MTQMAKLVPGFDRIYPSNDAILLTAVGDVFPGNLPYHGKQGIAGKFHEHNGSVWAEAFERVFGGSDLCIANLESPLLPEYLEPHNKKFAGCEKFASYMKKTGLHVVSVANNHTLEYGEAAFGSTCDILQKNGISVIGRNCQVGGNIFAYKKNDVSVSVAAFNSIHDIPNPNSYTELTEEGILTAVKSMEGSDFKIVVFHWGNEYVNIPSYEQIQLAKRLIDSGVDVIIGHHPHVIQPIMYYKSGIVLFSLGNFLFDMTYKRNVRTGMAAHLLLKKGEKPKCSLEGIWIKKDFTPAAIPRSEFDKIYSKHQKLFDRYAALSEADYILQYNKMHKLKRTLQRMSMKMDIIGNINNISKVEMQNLLKKFRCNIRGA